MAINVTTSKQQIQASVADDKITATVSSGFGATGPSGVINVTAPITNTGTTTNANVGISVGSGLSVSGGSLIVTPDTYATLVDGKVPSGQLPSYVDDVIEVASYGNLPSPGEQGKIYVITGTNRCFRWSGFAWVEIVASPGTTDALPEGNVNLYHTTARAAAAAPVQSVNGQTGAVTITAGSSAWNDITGKPTFATVATSGSYADLTNIPGSFTPSSHTHGSITNDGKVGSAADKVLVTTAAGAVTATSSITFSQVASTSTYTNFSTTPGDLHSSLSGIDSALTDRALASDFDQGLKTTDSPEFASLAVPGTLTMYNGDITIGPSGGTFVIAGFGVYIDIEQRMIGGNGIVGWSFIGDVDFTNANVTGIDAADVGAAALSHAHSAADVTSGTFDIARIPTGTSSTTVAVGNHTHAASDIASGTLSVSRLPVVLEQTQSIGNSGANKTLSLSTGSVQTVTLSASCTFTMPTATAGASITLILTQGSNYTATFTGVKWPNGSAPTITATTNAVDILVFVSDGTNWYGTALQKFS